VVLVSHQPPRGTRCDHARAGHVGSTAIREAILRHQPDLVLCGLASTAPNRQTTMAAKIVTTVLRRDTRRRLKARSILPAPPGENRRAPRGWG
jgi:hypothetical protein